MKSAFRCHEGQSYSISRCCGADIQSLGGIHQQRVAEGTDLGTGNTSYSVCGVRRHPESVAKEMEMKRIRIMNNKPSAYFCLLIGYIGLIIVSLIAIHLNR